MNKSLKTALIGLLLAAGIGLAVFGWMYSQPSKTPAPVNAPAIVASPPPAPLKPLEEINLRPEPATTEAKSVPSAATERSVIPGQSQQTDSFLAAQQITNAIHSLITPKQIGQFLQLEPIHSFARRIVGTVDNLPREHASVALWPVNPMPGRFVTGAGLNDHPLGMTTVSPLNAARYQPFVAFVESINSAKAVAFYQNLYPLFQQAYVELGYPNGSFHPRLLEVIDHLISLPVQVQVLSVSRVEIKGPFRPVRPWVTYEFTDPALNALSAGQKMLLRTGSANHQRLRNKLIELQTQLNQMPQPLPG